MASGRGKEKSQRAGRPGTLVADDNCQRAASGSIRAPDDVTTPAWNRGERERERDSINKKGREREKERLKERNTER